MNWQQLYTACNPEERLELLLHMLHVIEARHNKLVLIPLSINALLMGRGQGWGLRRERRGARVAHFIRDRRGTYTSRAVMRTLFMYTLGTVSLSVWLIALHIPHEIGAPLVFAYEVMLITLLLIDPTRITLALLTRATEA